MFCTQCGQRNTDDSKFCIKCGALLQTQPEPTTIAVNAPAQEPIAATKPDAESRRFYVPPRDSSAVTLLAAIGFVFGIIGMLGFFDSFLRSLAFFVGIPALLVSLISVLIAFVQNAKKSLAITAVTICGIGIAVSYWQYSSIISPKYKADQKTKEMLGRNPSTTQNNQRSVSQPKNSAIGTIKVAEFQGNNFLKLIVKNSKDNKDTLIWCSGGKTRVYASEKTTPWSELVSGRKVKVVGNWINQDGEKLLWASKIELL